MSNDLSRKVYATDTGTSSYEIPSFLRVVDMSSSIYDIMPDATPLLFLTNEAVKGKPRVAKDPLFKFTEYEERTFHTLANGAVDATTQDITVDDASKFAVDMLVSNMRTLEVMRIVSISASNTSINVIRNYTAWGSQAVGTGWAIVDNDVLIMVTDLYAEGAPARDGIYETPIELSNYTQIFRTPFEITGTAAETEVLAGKPSPAEIKARQAVFHRIKIENAFLFGQKKLDQTTFKTPARTTGGLLSYITTNVHDAGGTLTEEEFNNEFAYKAFYSNPEPKLLLAGKTIKAGIFAWAKDKIRLSPESKKYGIKLYSYMTPFGEFMFAPHARIMDYSSTYHGMAWSLHVNNIGRVVLGNRDTKLRQLPTDTDSERYEYISELGMEMKHEKTFALLKNVTEVI